MNAAAAADDCDDNVQYYVFPSPPPHDSSEHAPRPEAPASSPPLPSLETVGGKALSLIASSAAGFPVPPGLVLTVEFFRPWLERVKETEEWKRYVDSNRRRRERQHHNRQRGGGGGGEEEDDVEYEDGEEDSTAATKDDCDAIKERCRRILTLSDDQTSSLEEAVRIAFGGASPSSDSDSNGTPSLVVAVRSSSPEEDLSGASFAGGYETTLGVTVDATKNSAAASLASAIVDSFASMFDHRVHSYKEAQRRRGGARIADHPRIAIVVQRQIDSAVSGVGLSINPSNNCYDELVISANFGLGESVVGGIVTPDAYVVDRYDPEGMRIAERRVAEKTSSIWLKEGGGTRREDQGESSASSSPALTDERILEVASLVVRVEEEMYNGGDGPPSPVDVEWAYDREGKLHLLQARPVTAYVPLFPEMITPRGEGRRLYLDIMVMTQGFSEPLSILGLDLWRTMLARIKPTMSTEGRDGLVWNLHGREYSNVSNVLMMTGGAAMVNKGFRTYDKSIDRAFDSIDIKDYTPSEVPEGAKGIFWKSIKQLGMMLPYIFKGLYKGDESMTAYIDGSNAIIEKCHGDDCSKDESFGEAYEKLTTEYSAVLLSIGGLMTGNISRAWLHNYIFAKREDANDYLINMCMDLNGNPTSEMGHSMVRLAAYPEIRETGTGDDFVRKLEDGSFSEEFANEYDVYLKKFGCRGIREIDAATPRTHEDPASLFDTLKAIDVEKNQIINVRERRDKAYRELLKMAKDLNQEKQFVHHAGIIQSLLGYREHPKYMLVVIIARMRRHALNIAKDFVAQGRLEDVDQIFALTIEQVTEAQKDVTLKLLPLVEANMDPVRKVSHVKNWPILIDSRGKIIRGVRRDVADANEGTLLGDPISPGTVTGRAKVLSSPYEKPVRSGEILVARFTEPSWTPLFINAAGVVMEVGGPTQHGAIIAREYGIPCVSGIDAATKVIKDGDLLEVDGSSGVVKIADDGGNEEVSTGAKD